MGRAKKTPLVVGSGTRWLGIQVPVIAVGAVVRQAGAGGVVPFPRPYPLSPLTVDGVSTIPLLFLAHPPWPWSYGSCLFLGEPKLRWKGSVEGQRAYTRNRRRAKKLIRVKE